MNRDRALMIVGAVLWCGLVFVATFYLTFPSDTVAQRIEADAPRILGNDYAVDVGRVSPWWVGIAASDLKVFRATRADWRDEQAPERQLMAVARDVRIRASPWSLLTRTPYVSGSVTLTEGRVNYAVGTSTDERGNVVVSEVDIGSRRLPLADLLMLIPGFTGTATGQVDIEATIEAGDKGMSDAQGRIEVSGAELVLSDLEIPGIGPLGMDVPVSSLIIAGDIRSGKWDIERGLIQSNLLEVKIEGNLALRDPIDRSTIDIELAVSNLGDQFAAFESLMASAKGSDGAYHYQCRGMVTRLRGCQPARSTASRSANTRRPASSGRVQSTPIAPSPEAGPRPAEPTDVDAERERRREEIRERLRQRREERGDNAVDEPAYEPGEPAYDPDGDEPPFDDEAPPYDPDDEEFVEEGFGEEP